MKFKKFGIAIKEKKLKKNLKKKKIIFMNFKFFLSFLL